MSPDRARARRRAGLVYCLILPPHGFMHKPYQSYFLMRRLERVRAEFSLTVLAYNLGRVLNIVGMARLMAALS